MSAHTDDGELTGSRTAVRRRHISVRLLVVCAVIWVLLWGDLSIANLLAGAALGLLIMLVFPLPPIAFHGRLHPVAALRLVARLGYDLVRASAGVVATAFRFGYLPRNAVIKVQLRSHSDIYLSQTAELVSLVPGSLVLEARRSTNTLYLHVMDVAGPDDLERARRDVLDAEARVIRALGDAEEIAALNDNRPLPDREES